MVLPEDMVVCKLGTLTVKFLANEYSTTSCVRLTSRLGLHCFLASKPSMGVYLLFFRIFRFLTEVALSVHNKFNKVSDSA